MGLDMHKTSLYEFVLSIRNIQLDIQKYRTNIKKKNIESLIRHPYITNLYSEKMYNIVREKSNVSNYISIQRLKSILPPSDNILYTIIDPWKEDSYTEGYEKLTLISKDLILSFKKRYIKLEEEFLHSFIKILNKVYSSMKKLIELENEFNLRIFLEFVIKNFSYMRISFNTKVSSPIQITSLSESLGIDFENVIILSCNEGNLPNNQIRNSLIPLKARIKYNIPFQRQDEAEESYMFYRLWHRSKNINLVYTQDPTNQRIEEKSRYIMQVSDELSREENIEIKNITIKQNINYQLKSTYSIAKTDRVHNEIIKFIQEKNIGPTTLLNYMISPLNFFYTRILRIEDNIEESDKLIFGNLIHSIMNNLYAPYKRKSIKHSDIESNNLPSIIESEINRNITKIKKK